MTMMMKTKRKQITTTTNTTTTTNNNNDSFLPFQSYLTFNRNAVSCLTIFTISYTIMLICTLPMLRTMTKDANHPFEGVHLPKPDVSSVKGSTIVRGLREEWERIRHHGKTDADLLAMAVEEFEKEKAEKKGTSNQFRHQDLAIAWWGQEEDDKLLTEEETTKTKTTKTDVGGGVPVNDGVSRGGFVVLGMHRSGTSMLSGLMVQGMGYNVGGPLIEGAFDNEKGFFERVDVVLQNDEFFQLQRMGWSYNVIKYNSDLALQHKSNGKAKFREGQKALTFFNDQSNVPWLQKDPRMCITLRTWLRLLNSEPAVLFTYRHPLEVALSLKKREKNFLLEAGFRLWIVYNMRAIQNSADLCRVTSSNDAILANPLMELQRISDQLTNRCNVPPSPKRLSQRIVDDFIDVSLQHNNKKKPTTNQRILKTYGTDCIIREYDSDYDETSPNWDRERELYIMAMKIYCDLKSGDAYKRDYEWPQLQ